MSAGKHTAGPWRAGALLDGLGDRPKSYLIETISDSLYIADVPAGYSANRDERATHRANARLIAAAPDLLNALKMAESHLEEMRKDKKWHPIGDCPVLTMLRATIAKATRQS